MAKFLKFSLLFLVLMIDSCENSSLNQAFDFRQFPGKLCKRDCKPNDSRICYFKFVLEHYQAMGVACGSCSYGNETDCYNPQCIVGDGFERGVLSINRQIPGPSIQVCQNDRIIVDVFNKAHGTAAAIHWHGMHMFETPWMDGVPFITQCPIDFGTAFRYEFIAREKGTHFYHSHSGLQKINGQYGAIVIRQPRHEDQHTTKYDFDMPEHFIIASGWLHEYAEELAPGLPHRKIAPESLLVNGLGTYIDQDTGERKTGAHKLYFVQPQKRYRFRFINSVNVACPIQIQVEQHRMTIIATDSYNVEPFTIDTLISNSGERFDFVLETSQNPGDYWIRVIGLGLCNGTDSVAMLRYIPTAFQGGSDLRRRPPSMPNFNDLFPQGLALNYPNLTCFDVERHYCVTELSALKADDELRYGQPNHQFFLSFNNYPIANEKIFNKGEYINFINLYGNVTVIGGINNISARIPNSPLLTEPENIDESAYCNEFNVPKHCEGQDICSCIHRIQVLLNNTVELIVVGGRFDVGHISHPFHLHGNAFIVTGLGRKSGVRMTKEVAQDLESRNELERTSTKANPVWKDTISIPSLGYVIIRFRANNPGYWILHCHYAWHLDAGMGLTVQVGENYQMVRPPPGFPKCNNYLPGLLPNLT